MDILDGDEPLQIADCDSGSTSGLDEHGDDIPPRPAMSDMPPMLRDVAAEEAPPLQVGEEEERDDMHAAMADDGGSFYSPESPFEDIHGGGLPAGLPPLPPPASPPPPDDEMADDFYSPESPFEGIHGGGLPAGLPPLPPPASPPPPDDDADNVVPAGAPSLPPASPPPPDDVTSASASHAAAAAGSSTDAFLQPAFTDEAADRDDDLPEEDGDPAGGGGGGGDDPDDAGDGARLTSRATSSSRNRSFGVFSLCFGEPRPSAPHGTWRAYCPFHKYSNTTQCTRTMTVPDESSDELTIRVSLAVQT